MRLAHATTTVLCALLLAGSIGAQTEQAAAEVLFREARAAMKHGNYAEACPKLAESQRLDPSTGTLLNLALCEEHTGRLTQAWLHLRAFLDTIPRDDDRVPAVREHLADLDARLPRLTLELTSRSRDSNRLLLDGAEVPPVSWGSAIPVDSGEHVIVARSEGANTFQRSVRLAEGERYHLTLDLPASTPVGMNLPQAPGVRDVPITKSSLPAAPAHGACNQRCAGTVLVGVGVGGLIAGILAGRVVLEKRDVVKDPSHCQNGHCDEEGLKAAADGKTWSLVSTLSVGAGAVAAATGGFLLVYHSNTRVSIDPARSSSDGVVITLRTAF